MKSESALAHEPFVHGHSQLHSGCEYVLSDSFIRRPLCNKRLNVPADAIQRAGHVVIAGSEWLELVRPQQREGVIVFSNCACVPVHAPIYPRAT